MRSQLISLNLRLYGRRSKIELINLRTIVFCTVFCLWSTGFGAAAKPADKQAAAQKSLDLGSSKKNKPELPILDRFEYEIRAFEANDLKEPPKPGGTVFVGSSTFRFWTGLEQIFSAEKALNRGFGGSTFPDLNHYVERIVSKYKPAKIVVYAGTNDIAELHHSGKDIASDFKEFVARVQADLPQAEIYFVSMSVAPSRLIWADQYEQGNALIRHFINASAHLHYIDVLPVMRRPNGELRTELFGADRLHMNAEGYALWAPVIKAALHAADLQTSNQPKRD